jgi:hypothetical protein
VHLRRQVAVKKETLHHDQVGSSAFQDQQLLRENKSEIQKQTYADEEANQGQDAQSAKETVLSTNVRCEFSKVSFLLILLYKLTISLTFENFVMMNFILLFPFIWQGRDCGSASRAAGAERGEQGGAASNTDCL